MARMMAPESIGSELIYLEHSAENAGKYLMRVIDAHDNARPTKDGLEPINGFSAECEVVGGDNDGKKFTLTLYNGKLSSKDGGKFAAQKQLAFLLATDVVTPDVLGKEFDFDPVDSVNSFFVIELALGQPTDSGKSYLDLHYSNLYHVDDPRSRFKFDAAQKAKLDTIAAANRHKEEYFSKLTNKPATAKKEVKNSAPLDLDDL